MSRLEKYPKYKDSGIEWIGEIPEHWEVNKIQYILYEKKKTHNIELNCGSISYGKVVYKDDEKIPHSTKRAYQVVKAGDFLINPLNLNYDLKSLRIALSNLNVVVSSGYIVLDTRKNINKRYLNYLLHRFDVAFMKTLGAGVRQTLSYTDIAKCELIEPPIEEQTKIADYIDKKTAQIDKAITLKEQLIEKLGERRQVLINDAVTKGLDKNVKMKESGIEWIGEIPEHWKVNKIQYILYEKKKTHNIELNCGSISYGKVVYKDDEKIPHSTKRAYQVVKAGDFLINPLNLNYDLKSLRIALSNLNVVVSSGYIVLDTRKNINKRYLNYLLHRFDVAFMKTLGAGVRQTLSYTDIAKCELIEPPIEEQTKIADYIDKKTAQIDKAISLQEKQIEKLKEYKATVIDSIVSGKVRVS